MTLLDANSHAHFDDMSNETDETVRMQPVQRWPLKEEYDVALMNLRRTVLDLDIRAGQLATDKSGILPYGGANLYICIYRVSDWMVRFFRTNPNYHTPDDIQERYRAIARYCDEHTLSCLLPVTYIERGILIGNRVFPLVKMPFLSGCLPLGEFVLDNYQESEVMHRLCDAWLRMIHELEEAHIAHGDLDLTNVLVQEQGQRLTLKLIDYDNMWIPDLRTHTQTEYGHVHFQHPCYMPPNVRPYNQEMDRFSAMSIYISLRTIAEHPELYDEYGANEDDRLLFSEYDYKNAGLVDSRLQQLRALNIRELMPYLDELDDALKGKRMPCSLDDISTHKLQIVRSKHATKSLAPATSLWGQAIYNANSLQPSLSTLSSIPSLPSTPLTPTLPLQSTIPMPTLSSTMLANKSSSVPMTPIPVTSPSSQTVKRFPWTLLPRRRSSQTTQRVQRLANTRPYTGSYARKESPRGEVPSWLLITLIIVCILLFIAIAVIFVLILQRHTAQTTLVWPITTIHSYYAHTLLLVRRNG